MISPSPEYVSPVRKRSVVIGGHKTSLSMEDAFWDALREIAAASKCTISDLVGEVDSNRAQGNLSSEMRLRVLSHYQARPQQ